MSGIGRTLLPLGIDSGAIADNRRTPDCRQLVLAPFRSCALPPACIQPRRNWEFGQRG
jgi:hypothetical protein